MSTLPLPRRLAVHNLPVGSTLFTARDASLLHTTPLYCTLLTAHDASVTTGCQNARVGRAYGITHDMLPDGGDREHCIERGIQNKTDSSAQSHETNRAALLVYCVLTGLLAQLRGDAPGGRKLV